MNVSYGSHSVVHTCVALRAILCVRQAMCGAEFILQFCSADMKLKFDAYLIKWF